MKLRGIIVLLVLLVGLLYVILNNTREHLTPGPPTLLTLQTDTQDLDSRLTELKTEFDKMSAQAKQGADAAAQSKAQMAVLKNS
jgi:hypothetical protein